MPFRLKHRRLKIQTPENHFLKGRQQTWLRKVCGVWVVGTEMDPYKPRWVWPLTGKVTVELKYSIEPLNCYLTQLFFLLFYIASYSKSKVKEARVFF